MNARTLVALLVALASIATTQADEAVFVDAGVAKLVQTRGQEWTAGDGYLECSGVNNLLVAGKMLGGGDCRVTVELTITNLANSAASIAIGETSHFGFEGSTGLMFTSGPLFGGETTMVGSHADLFEDGRPFRLEVVRQGNKLTMSVDGKEMQTWELDSPDSPLGPIALRPWRSTMRIHHWLATGQLIDLPTPPEQTDVYTAGQGDYHTYRIPSAIVTTKGTVLAFCEGRKEGRGDAGDIDILLRRSQDGGRTFSQTQVVWNDDANTCGNPCPVVDRTTGVLWLLLTHNRGQDHERDIVAGKTEGSRTVWLSHSDDDGVTWADPVEITSTTKLPEWTWYATGPGAGIQLESGRLVIPCDHITDGGDLWSSHVIYSDDHGATWQLGGSAPPKTNECEVVELSDGRLLLNMRNYNRDHPCRAIATSDDGGETWSEVTYDATLVEPVCQASIRRYPFDGGAILFSNPAATGSRSTLTIRLSRDDCATWAISKVLHAGPAAYSSLTVLPDGTVLCLYERGVSGAYEQISLARFGMEWLGEE